MNPEGTFYITILIYVFTADNLTLPAQNNATIRNYITIAKN